MIHQLYPELQHFRHCSTIGSPPMVPVYRPSPFIVLLTSLSSVLAYLTMYQAAHRISCFASSSAPGVGAIGDWESDGLVLADNSKEIFPSSVPLLSTQCRSFNKTSTFSR